LKGSADKQWGGQHPDGKVFRLRPQPDLYALLAEVHLSGALGYRVRGVQQQRAGGQNASSQREIR
jgi:hypothetical protein